MPDINSIVNRAQMMNASDIHLVADRPVKCRIDGRLTTLDEEPLSSAE